MLIYTVRPAIFCHVYNIHCKIQNGHFPSLSQSLPVITRRTPVKFPESSDKITEIPISDLKSYLHYGKWCCLQQDTRLLDAVTVQVLYKTHMKRLRKVIGKIFWGHVNDLCGLFQRNMLLIMLRNVPQYFF